jgi:hypothetical protein
MGAFRVAAAVALAAALSPGLAFGQTFHNGAVAYCEGCHTMHNSGEAFVNSGAAPKPQMTSRDLGVGTTNRCAPLAATAPAEPAVSRARLEAGSWLRST